MEPGFEWLPHTADAGVRARGPDLRAALDRAVAGWAALTSGEAPAPGAEEREAAIEAADLEELVVAVLEEAVYLLDARRWLATGVAAVDWPGPGRVRLRGRPAPEVAPRVKAVTWHGLSAEERDDGVVFTVYFDL